VGAVVVERRCRLVPHASRRASRADRRVATQLAQQVGVAPALARCSRRRVCALSRLPRRTRRAARSGALLVPKSLAAADGAELPIYRVGFLGGGGAPAKLLLGLGEMGAAISALEPEQFFRGERPLGAVVASVRRAGAGCAGAGCRRRV